MSTLAFCENADVLEWLKMEDNRKEHDHYGQLYRNVRSMKAKLTPVYVAFSADEPFNCLQSISNLPHVVRNGVQPISWSFFKLFEFVAAPEEDDGDFDVDDAFDGNDAFAEWLIKFTSFGRKRDLIREIRDGSYWAKYFKHYNKSRRRGRASKNKNKKKTNSYDACAAQAAGAGNYQIVTGARGAYQPDFPPMAQMPHFNLQQPIQSVVVPAQTPRVPSFSSATYSSPTNSNSSTSFSSAMHFAPYTPAPTYTSHIMPTIPDSMPDVIGSNTGFEAFGSVPTNHQMSERGFGHSSNRPSRTSTNHRMSERGFEHSSSCLTLPALPTLLQVQQMETTAPHTFRNSVSGAKRSERGSLDIASPAKRRKGASGEVVFMKQTPKALPIQKMTVFKPLYSQCCGDFGFLKKLFTLVRVLIMHCIINVNFRGV